MRLFCVAAALVPLVFAGLPALAQSAGRAEGAEVRACTFPELSAEEQRRYQSRYKRRVRIDGQAFADQWLFDQVCLTAEQRKEKRRKPLLNSDGKPCKRTRLEMRVTPGYDGPMSMTPVPVCAD